MVASQIRANARESLVGKWGKAALLTLSYIVIMFAINWVVDLLVAIPFIGLIVAIAQLVISVPIAYGLVAVYIKLKRGEEVGYVDFLTIAFENIGKAWGVTWGVVLKLLPLVIGLVVSIILLSVSIVGAAGSSIYGSASGIGSFGILGIIGFIGYIVCLILMIPKGFLYSLVYQILFDNPDMTGKQIAEESARLMMGHRWQLFWLQLTFIGWSFLAVFTFGIGYLWLVPYMMVAVVCFYEELKGDTKTETTTEVKSEDNGPIVEG